MNTLKEFAGVLAVSLSAACLGMAGLPGDWRIRETPVTTHLTAVASAPGHLVAVGQGATILTSVDGNSWYASAYAGTGDFHCATFGKGIYVVGGTFDCLLAISPDGLNWTNIQSTVGQHTHFGLTFGAGRFVAVGRGGLQIPTRIFTSTNGFDWQPASVPPTTNTLRAVTFGNGKYVAVGERGTILTSTDATTWTLQISGTEHLLRSVIFTGREFLAGGDSSTLLTSGDGLTWVTVPFSSFDVRGLATSGTAVVGVGAFGAEGRAQSSTDGLSWTGGAQPFPDRLNGVVQFDLGRFVAVGNNGLVVDTAAWADTPINIWTNNASGFWHDPYWSLGHIPSWKDQSVVFTNVGSNTIEINATTTRDYPDSLKLNRLVLQAADGSHNTLRLNGAGHNVQLLINTDFSVPPNTSLELHDSAIESPRLNLSSRAVFNESHARFRSYAVLGVMAPAEVVQSNGYFNAIGTTLGQNFRSTWRQSGGTNEAINLNLYRGSAYTLDTGRVVAGALTVSEGTFAQSGGTVQAGSLGARSYDLSGGLLITSNTSVYSSHPADAVRFTQSGGEHVVQEGLWVNSVYAMQSGSLSADMIVVYGRLHLTGGVVSNNFTAITGGILTARGAFNLGRLQPTRTVIIDLQDAATTLRFGDSRQVSWTSDSLVMVTNWTQGVDQLFIGHDQTGLAAAQLSRIRFVNPAGLSPGIYSARITPTGEVVPVPRIINYQRSASHLVLNWPENYRLWTATNVAGPYSLITNTIGPYTASYHTDPQRFFILRNEN